MDSNTQKALFENLIKKCIFFGNIFKSWEETLTKPNKYFNHF